jgi:multidrug efflux pump subunit AcrB
MIQRLIENLIQRKIFIILAVCLIIIGGVYSYERMPKQNYPEFSLPVASVVVIYPGATAEDMEELVTKKVENTVMTLDGFDYSSSQSSDNVSAVLVSLDLNLSEARVDQSFDDLRLKIDALRNTLPTGVTQIIVDTDTMDTAGLLVAVTGENDVTGDELSLWSSELESKLMQINGVRKTAVYGEQLSEVQITVDSNRLNTLDLSIADLASIISAQNTLIPTGDLEVDDQIISVYTSGKFESVDEIKSIIVGGSKDTGVLYQLSDIAQVQIKTPEDAAGYSYNKVPCTIMAVYFDKGVNVVRLGDTVRDTLDSFNKTLPQGVQVKDVYLQPDVVKSAINDFGSNVLVSIILVLIVVLLGIGLHNALVVSIAIPLSIACAFIVMPIFGIDIQFVSLAALIVVLGMLVDNSIVINDAIQIRMDQGEDKLSAVKHGTADVARPVFAATLTTIAGFSSLLTLTGAYKQLAFSMPVVIIACLIASFMISMVVTPLISYIFLQKSKVGKYNLMQRLAEAYDHVFQMFYQHKIKTMVISVLFLGVCLSSLLFIDLELTPKSNKDVITIQVTSNDAKDIQKTRAVVKQIEAILDEQSEVSYYLTGVGIGIPRYEYSVLPKGQNDALGDILVRVDIEQSDRYKMTKDMVAFLQQELDTRVVGGSAVVDEHGIMAFMSKPIEMKLYGDDFDSLNSAASQVTAVMNSMAGISNLNDSGAVQTYHYYVDMDSNQLNAMGLTKAEVQNELSLAILGRDVTIYRQRGKEYAVVLDSTMNTLEDLKNFKVKSSVTGNKYAVQQFADITLVPRMTQIDRISGQRGRTVGGYLSPGYSAIAVQHELEQRLKDIELPQGVVMERSGDKKEFTKFIQSILLAAVFSFVVIFLLLLFQFNSIKKSLMVFISIPFGAAAGIAALYLTGLNLAMFAIIGILSLTGAVLANAIVLIDYIDTERAHGVTIAEACRSAGAKRFRPIIVSTMTSVLGLLPLAINGDPFFKPMATLMLVGLIVAMCINLIIIPIIYEMVYSRVK